jgi:hypothetical protein
MCQIERVLWDLTMLTTSVSYQAPTYVRTQIGSKPAHTFDQNDRAETPQMAFPSDSYELGGEVKVWGDVPVKNADGTPRLSTREAELNLVPRSPLKYGLVSGLVSAGVGAALGAIGSGSQGIAARLGAVLGALARAGLAGAWAAAHYAAGDDVRLEWREEPIVEKSLVGYHHNVYPHFVQRCSSETDGQGNTRQRCWTEQDGYDHRFSPDVNSWPVGSSIAPKVVHFQDGTWRLS